MAKLSADSEDAKRIDVALEHWRQGDVALDEKWFVHVGDPAQPLTDAAAEEGDAGPVALTTEVDGLVVVTQTCDIVRPCIDRPFVEVSPLVAVNRQYLQEIERGRRPAYAIVSALAERALVAHLDRVMTVEKAIVAGWARTSGWTTDDQARAFASTLSRKRARFAFPDDFTVLAKTLQSRLTHKHGKNTREGRALRALREIRVQAAPSWDSSAVTLMFWFIRHDQETDFEGTSWADLVDGWLRLVAPSTRFVAIHGQLATLADVTAAEYLQSDPLDLDHLSQPDA